MTNPVLVADCVAKSFGGKRVLSSASLRAVPGELRVMLGRNGGGKSTLIRIAAGVTCPDSGSVHFDGHAYVRVTLSKLASQGLFYLPDHDLLSPAFSCVTQLKMIQRQFNGLDPDEAAERMGVTEHLGRRTFEMSGGQMRRMELAAVLVRRPRCLLADEPYRGVEPIVAERLTRTFSDLAREGVAIIVTGHEVPTLLAAADHVTWCPSGTTYELGSPVEATGNEQFRREYLGPS